MSAATTLGTAYGTKMPSRITRDSRSRPLSSARANSRASSSITGTWTTKNSATRPTPCRSMAGFVPGDDWVAALREMALRVRDGYLAHPRAAAFASYRVTRRPNGIRAVDTGIGLLLSAGFGPADATHLYLTFVDTVLSHVAMDAAHQALPREQREADDQAWQDVYQGLDPASYPALTAVRQDLRTVGKSSFEEAVDLLLEALAARAPARRPPGPASPPSGPARTRGDRPIPAG